jgi:hypothetical protein
MFHNLMYNGFVIVLHPTLVQGNSIVYLIHCASTHKSLKKIQIMCTHVNLWNLCQAQKCSFVLCNQNMKQKQHSTLHKRFKRDLKWTCV